jgi:hypothetical protein
MTLIDQSVKLRLLLILLPNVAFPTVLSDASAPTRASKNGEKVTVIKVDDAQFVQMMQRLKEQAYGSIFATMASKR